MTARLLLWTCIGALGTVGVIYGGYTSRWPIFIPSLLAAFSAQFMLGTGLFLRWPHFSSKGVS